MCNTTKLYVDWILFSEIDDNSDCVHEFTFRGPQSGIFTSPGFPEDYPERTQCSYFFHAADGGRVKIVFDYFDLEEPSDNG